MTKIIDLEIIITNIFFYGGGIGADELFRKWKNKPTRERGTGGYDKHIEMCKKLKTFCGNMSTTFHRAFDETLEPFDALKSIIDLKFDRILTSGQKENAEEGVELIIQLAEKSKNKISIMPGSGIRSSNIDLFLKHNNINEIHTSSYSNGKFSTDELKKIIKKITQ